MQFCNLSRIFHKCRCEDANSWDYVDKTEISISMHNHHHPYIISQLRTHYNSQLQVGRHHAHMAIFANRSWNILGRRLPRHISAHLASAARLKTFESLDAVGTSGGVLNFKHCAVFAWPPLYIDLTNAQIYIFRNFRD